MLEGIPLPRVGPVLGVVCCAWLQNIVCILYSSPGQGMARGALFGYFMLPRKIFLSHIMPQSPSYAFPPAVAIVCNPILALCRCCALTLIQWCRKCAIKCVCASKLGAVLVQAAAPVLRHHSAHWLHRFCTDQALADLPGACQRHTMTETGQ